MRTETETGRKKLSTFTGNTTIFLLTLALSSCSIKLKSRHAIATETSRQIDTDVAANILDAFIYVCSNENNILCTLQLQHYTAIWKVIGPIKSYHNEGERSEKRSDRIEWYYMIMKVND